MVKREAGPAGGLLAMEKVYDRVRRAHAWDHLRTDGARLVPGFGSYEPRVLVVGGAPGAMDQTQQRPFSGPIGAVAMELMGLAGLYAKDQEYIRANTFMTNVVKYRIPGRRDPNLEEILAGQRVLRQEWSILGGPQVIVTLGPAAWRAMYDGPVRFIGKNTPTFTTPDGTHFWRMVDPATAMARPLLRDGVEESWEALGRWLEKERVLAPAAK